MNSALFHVQRSKILLRFLLLVHLVLLLFSWLIPLSFWVGISCTGFLLCSCCFHVQKWCLDTYTLWHIRGDHWLVSAAESDPVNIQIMAGCRLGEWSVLIPVQGEFTGRRQRKRLLILKDSLSERDYRLLRMRLLLSG